MLLLNRYIDTKQINPTIHRHLIKDLQRFKDQALVDKQIVECLRTIEARISKFDYGRQFDEVLIKKLENQLKDRLNVLSNSFEQHLRADIFKKLNELVEDYVKSSTNQKSSDEFLMTFDSYITNIKESHPRSSKTHYHYASSHINNTPISHSLQSLQNPSSINRF